MGDEFAGHIVPSPLPQGVRKFFCRLLKARLVLAPSAQQRFQFGGRVGVFHEQRLHLVRILFSHAGSARNHSGQAATQCLMHA